MPPQMNSPKRRTLKVAKANAVRRQPKGRATDINRRPFIHPQNPDATTNPVRPNIHPLAATPRKAVAKKATARKVVRPAVSQAKPRQPRVRKATGR